MAKNLFDVGTNAVVNQMLSVKLGTKLMIISEFEKALETIKEVWRRPA